MQPDWKAFCSGPKFQFEGDNVRVRLDGERQQLVEVSESDEAIHLQSIVARPAALSDFENAALRTWQRNRSVSLVGFRIDAKGRLIGESWVPTAGLTRDEFQLWITNLAAECDRFEFQITGSDTE